MQANRRQGASISIHIHSPRRGEIGPETEELRICGMSNVRPSALWGALQLFVGLNCNAKTT